MAIKMGARQAKTQANRQKLIEVASALFDQYGYDNVTIDDICEQAELSKGSFYNIFKAKEDLLMISESARRSEYLKAHFAIDEAVPYCQQLLDFFRANFGYIQTVSKEKARNTYISYIRTMRGYAVDRHFYHITLNLLIDRGLLQGAFAEKWDKETLYWMLHDWIIGLQIGWSIAPEHIGDSRYYAFIEAFIRGILK